MYKLSFGLPAVLLIGVVAYVVYHFALKERFDVSHVLKKVEVQGREQVKVVSKKGSPRSMYMYSAIPRNSSYDVRGEVIGAVEQDLKNVGAFSNSQLENNQTNYRA